eukprot:2515490-Lingulodinium_polyedra.AAC.1
MASSECWPSRASKRWCPVAARRALDWAASRSRPAASLGSHHAPMPALILEHAMVLTRRTLTAAVR